VNNTGTKKVSVMK